MREFLEHYGLYRVYTLHEEYDVHSKNFVIPPDFIGQTFEYKCENEDAYRTFEIELEKSYEPYYGYDGRIPNDFIIDDKLNHTFKAICKCKSCKEYHIEFLLHVFANLPIPKTLIQLPVSRRFDDNEIEEKVEKKASIFIEKVGANPEIKIIPNSLITNYFDRETNVWYYKGINSLDKNFGIGALAYFRRIIEKELIHIVESIKQLPDSHTSEIQKLLDKHSENP